MKQIIQIVPSLPPAISGVGDYALLLAQQLRKGHGINTQFVVCDTNWENSEILKAETLKPEITDTSSGLRPPSPQGVEGTSEIGNLKSEMELDGFPLYQLKERSAEGLLRVLSQPGMPQTVLLQYVGYGYEKRGCPVWLMRALGAWHKALGARRLVTMFHELYAFGPPWRSSFWTTPMQQWIARTLAELSDGCLTNRAVSAGWLVSDRHPVGSIPVLPVFSNLGEVVNPLPLASRKSQMLLYDNVCLRPDAASLVCHACEKMGIERVILLGRQKVVRGLEIGRTLVDVGSITSDSASQLLAESCVGCLDYFDGYLGKSGIFAAYCAHGLVPLLLFENHSEPDGLEINQHYWAAEAPPEITDVTAQQQIANQAHRWYRSHAVAETAQTYFNMLKES